MDMHEGQQETEKPAMKSSWNSSMIITSFVFMILMLGVTAPGTGPGPVPVMDHGPGLVQNDLTAPVAGPLPVLPIAGSGLAPVPASGISMEFYLQVNEE